MKWNTDTPFGYRIENGTAFVQPEEASQIRKVYEGYLSGLAYVPAAKAAGLDMKHSSVRRLLQNPHYLGDDFYPVIIDRKTFDAAEEERRRRSTMLGRDHLGSGENPAKQVPVRFVLGSITEEREDPYEQAAYIYSLIESEE